MGYKNTFASVHVKIAMNLSTPRLVANYMATREVASASFGRLTLSRQPGALSLAPSSAAIAFLNTSVDSRLVVLEQMKGGFLNIGFRINRGEDVTSRTEEQVAIFYDKSHGRS